MVQKNNIKPKIIIICGPTASGKTALAVEVAKRLNSEVISADSMYIYKGLNVGTAKPTEFEIQGIKHHLIDIINPDEAFSVSDYKRTAEPIIKSLIQDNKIPIICGGTGFYINSILYDLSYGNGKNNLDVRQKYKELAEKHGNLYVYNKLLEVDRDSAVKLHYNDIKRVIRALEIFESGVKKSQLNDEFIPKYDYKAFLINHDRTILYERINKRVDIMVKDGLINEVKSLYDKGIDENCQCMQAIGYKEILEFIKGEISLDDAIDNIKLNTRHYAKRQLTFFKKMPDLKYLTPTDLNSLSSEIIKEITNG